MCGMTSDTRKVVKASIWYTLSSFLLRSVSLITTPIYTRLMSKADFGAFSNFLSWYTIISLVTTLNLSASINRARHDFEDDLPKYLFSISTFGTALTLFCYFIVWLYLPFFVELLSLEEKYIHLIFITLSTAPSINIFLVNQRIKYKYKLSTALSVWISLSTVLISVLLVINFQDKLLARVYGHLLPNFIISIVLFLLLGARGGKISLHYWRYAFLICLPFLPHLLANNLLGSSDRIMITRFRGAEETALYSLAYNSGHMLSILWISMNNAFAPLIGDKLHTKQYDSIKQLSKPYVLIFVLPSIGAMLIGPEILLILGGSSYLDARFVMPPVIMSCIFQFVYALYVNVEQYEKKNWGAAMATAFAALLNIALNYLLIPTYGYIAAAYTTLAGYTVLAILHYLLVRRIGLHTIYDTRFLVYIVLASCIMMMVASVLYDYSLLRYVVVAVYCLGVSVMVYKNMPKIMMVIKVKH